MNADQALYELLDDYFSGKLTAEEAEAVENRLKSDPDFSAKAKQHKTMRDAMKFYNNRVELKHMLDTGYRRMEKILADDSRSSFSSDGKYIGYIVDDAVARNQADCYL